VIDHSHVRFNLREKWFLKIDWHARYGRNIRYTTENAIKRQLTIGQLVSIRHLVTIRRHLLVIDVHFLRYNADRTIRHFFARHKLHRRKHHQYEVAC